VAVAVDASASVAASVAVDATASVASIAPLPSMLS
jgi:hypothetical protein